jgi:hypothetical protein
MPKVLLLQFAVSIVFPATCLVAFSGTCGVPHGCCGKARKSGVCPCIAKTLTNPQLLFIFLKKPWPGRGGLEICSKTGYGVLI